MKAKRKNEPLRVPRVQQGYELNQEDKRLLETLLIQGGFKSIRDRAVIPFFAKTIEDNFHTEEMRHWCYRGLIGECEPSKRRDMYESLKPHFTSFKPKTLEAYETEITMEANRMISHGIMRVEGSRPDAIEIGDKKYIGVPDEFAKEFAVKLICKKCTRISVFIGTTPADALIKARKKGWVHDFVNDNEICHKCPAVRKKFAA